MVGVASVHPSNIPAPTPPAASPPSPHGGPGAPHCLSLAQKLVPWALPQTQGLPILRRESVPRDPAFPSSSSNPTSGRSVCAPLSRRPRAQTPGPLLWSPQLPRRQIWSLCGLTALWSPGLRPSPSHTASDTAPSSVSFLFLCLLLLRSSGLGASFLCPPPPCAGGSHLCFSRQRPGEAQPTSLG